MYYHIPYIVYLVAKSIRVKEVERDLIKGTSVCRAQCMVSVCCVCVLCVCVYVCVFASRVEIACDR